MREDKADKKQITRINTDKIVIQHQLVREAESHPPKNQRIVGLQIGRAERSYREEPIKIKTVQKKVRKVRADNRRLLL